MILPRSFFIRSDVATVARDLLGAVLVCGRGKDRTAGIIVETEAYKAPEDRGSHAYGNRRTSRTATLFYEGGIAYVYLCYGIHHLFNVVSGKEGEAHAVLIRAIQPIDGIGLMRSRRPPTVKGQNLTNGPGKFTRAMGISTDDDGSSLTTPEGRIQIETGDTHLSSDRILAGPRVGIAYAGPCALRPWRFRIKDNPWTSKPDRVSYAHWDLMTH